MLECLIVGDSIAVGMHQQMKACEVVAKGGYNTKQWNQMAHGASTQMGAAYDYAIISLGTNDHQYIKTQEELAKARQRVNAKRVFWVLPHDNLKAGGRPIETIQAWVKAEAEKHGDVVLPIKAVQPDNIHPSGRGYQQLAEAVRKNL